MNNITDLSNNTNVPKSNLPASLWSLKFIFLFISLTSGVITGLLLSVNLSEASNYSPKFLSGIPLIENGIISCLFTYLCNIFISLTVLLLMGLSMIGCAAVPIYLFAHGLLSAIRIFYFTAPGGLSDFISCIALYTPFLAVTGFILLRFGKKAMVLSVGLIKQPRRSELKNSDIQELFYEYLSSLVFAVAAVLADGLIFLIYSFFI